MANSDRPHMFRITGNKWFAYGYEGYAKRPSKQTAYSEGLSVGHVER